MKRCPECRRDYTDETLNFCLDDGSALLDGPRSVDEPATAVFGTPVSSGFKSEQKTEVLIARASEHVTPDPQKGTRNSIAVLPFSNISSDPDNEYFCDGLAEELLNGLAKIVDLKVAARTSAFSFRDKTADIGEIGRKLGVANVLEGSVRKSGDRLRIAVQLLNVSDGYHIWSETFDREMRNIFDVQDEITLAVIDALKLKLLGNTKASILKRETENTEAYKAYLRGRYLRYAKNDHSGAALAYEEAVRLDPSHAPSWVGLAETYVLQAHYGLILPREACLKANSALETAQKIQGESAEALYVRGFEAFVERDWTRCDASYRRANQLDPNNSRALGTFGVINCLVGRVDEALLLFESARNADPLAAYPYAMTGTGLVASKRLEESMPFFEQAFTFERDHPLTLWAYSVGCVGLERFEDGIAAAQRATEVTNRAGFFVGLLGWAFAAGGKIDEARSALQEIRIGPRHSAVLAWEACILGVLGEFDAAIEAFGQAVDENAPFACYIGLSCYDSLRDDARFAGVVKRLELPQHEL